MASMYDDFINAGLLSPNAEREAALMGLFAMGNQIGNRSAPRLSPTPPPMDLNAVMNVYQNQMNSALRRGAMRKQMQEREEARKLFAPQPINEPAAQAIADARFDQVQSGTMDVDEMDADIDARASAAREAALPAARQMTTTPVGLQGLPANLARVLGPIGLVNPELGAKTLASVLVQQQKGQGSQFNLLKYSDDVIDENGKYIGIRRFDPDSNSIVVDQGGGNLIPFDPEKHTPTNKSTFQKGVLAAPKMSELTDEIITTENSLRNLASYMQTQENTNIGFSRLIDTYTEKFKTFFAKGNYTNEELNRLLSKGQLQGLLGAFRIETVGGGVMTEQDAIRVLQNLGGDVTALQNPEVLKRQIGRLLKNKRAKYESLIDRYNNQVMRFYGQQGYQRRTPIGTGGNIGNRGGTRNGQPVVRRYNPDTGRLEEVPR